MSEPSLPPTLTDERRKHAPIFRLKYSPPGIILAEAKATGDLRESEEWWIGYRANGRTSRESAGIKRYEEARKLLRQPEAAVERREQVCTKADRGTFAEMAEALRHDYRRVRR